ncbi:Hypothetical predicted protein, partial [Paramuricea clavata]
QGGNSDNPTPVQFTRAFRKLFFSSFLNSSAGNCDDDLDTLLAQCTGKKRKLAKVPILVAPPPQPNTLDIGPMDYKENSVSSSLTRENAIAYVSGYLLKKCFTKHQCETCKPVLVPHELDDSRKLLCYILKHMSLKKFLLEG